MPEDLSSCEEPERWIKAYWADSGSTNFTSTLQINALNRDGLLAEVTSTLFNMHVALHAVNARLIKDGNCVITVTVSTSGVEHLKSILARLQKLSGVYSIERMNQ